MYRGAGRSAKRRYLDDGLSRLRDNERLSLRRLVDKFRELRFRFMNVYRFHDVTPYELSLIDLVYQFLAESDKKHADYDHDVPIRSPLPFHCPAAWAAQARIAKIFRETPSITLRAMDRSMDTINRDTIDVSLGRDDAQLPGDFVLFHDIGSIWSEPIHTEKDR